MTGDKQYWEGIYSSKNYEDTSWYQSKPEFSLNIIESLGFSHEEPIIDVGGGDSILAEALLQQGYSDISVLDIAENVIERAKERLGKNAEKIDWIVDNVTEFKPKKKYGFWHDRVTFHFLTEEKQIKKYLKVLNNSLKENGYLLLATFSENGPKNCSGLPIKQYSAEQMEKLLQDQFETVRIQNIDHTTPWDAKQNFTIGLFRKK